MCQFFKIRRGDFQRCGIDVWWHALTEMWKTQWWWNNWCKWKQWTPYRITLIYDRRIKGKYLLYYQIRSRAKHWIDGKCIILYGELLNSSSRILYFNEYLWIFQVFCSGQYISLWYTPVNNEQCIIIIYDSAGRKKTSFQQLSKLIELKFISLTWNHDLTLTDKVTYH